MFRIASVTAIFCAAIAPAASGQVTPDALWDAWQSGTGFVTATGAAARDGTTVVVDAPQVAIGALQLDADSLRMVAEGDATRIDLPDSFTMAQGDITAQIQTPDMVLLATGDASNVTYTLQAAQMDAALSGSTLTAELTVTGIDATVAPTATQAQIATLTMISPSAGFSASRSGVVLRIDGPLDALSTLAAGQAAQDVAITLDAASTGQETTLPDARGTLRVATGASLETATSTAGDVTLSQTVSDIQMTLDTPALPPEVGKLRIATATASLTGPAVARDTPSEMVFDLSLDGVEAAEDLWQLFDPGGSLPREPAQLQLSVTGEITRSSASRYVPSRAALEELDLSILGATLTGQGAAIFTRPDAPYGRPVGTLTFTLTGVIDLLDRLQALDTLPGGPLVGARMGLGFFTRPGAEEDQLTSTVKIGPDGIVTINEQAITQIPLRAAPLQ